MAADSIVTSDGRRLAADRSSPRGVRCAGVALCHPHPLYGGNRFHPLIDALYQGLPDLGFETVRFDFRSDHGKGVAERLDVAAAVDAVDQAGQPVFVVGYSFGAMVAMSTDHPSIAGVVAVAPPLGDDTLAPQRPTLILSPRHDQFCSYERAEAIAGGWEDTTVAVIESTDHFLHGRITWITDRVTGWLLAATA